MRQLFEEGMHEIPVSTHEHARGFQVHVDVREHKNPAVTIGVDFQVSTDDGATWNYGGGLTTKGNAAVDPKDKNGDPMRYTAVHFGLTSAVSAPAPKRLVKGTLTITGGSVNTSVGVIGTQQAGLDKALIPTD